LQSSISRIRANLPNPPGSARSIVIQSLPLIGHVLAVQFLPLQADLSM
jgi:hypothetical protein